MLGLIPMLMGCISRDQCNNKKPIEGIYKNTFVKQAENILIIKPDGTFEQVFTKDSLTKKNHGTWEFFKESCDVRFKNLIFLHDVPSEYIRDEIYKYPAIHRNDDILFIDHYDVSFYRKE
ncbi:hypothetical protein ED312_14580 [Sinomicrobium pectinilyticum]|uniref:Uncharacterized protein n=2 Tax=Sinomicrobium pectinilyticum TaxID=1084421 RepID=A0A3N0E787_SINP1|nr:hypothetical protein ED312_14580 [Sinomicrobium pectinilyticum]